MNPVPPSKELTREFSKDRDQIDLKEVLKTLWRGKMIIATSVLLFAITAVAYSLTSQQWWSTKALVTTPKVTDIAIFSKTVKRYQPAFDLYQPSSQPAFDLYQPNGNVISGRELDSLISQAAIFRRFIETFNSNDNKRAFFKSNKAFVYLLSNLNGKKELDETSYRLAIIPWLSRFSAKEQSRSGAEAYSLIVESSTDTSSFSLLKDYISYTNQKVSADLMLDLQSMLSIKRNEIEQQLESRLLFVEQQLQIEIAKAENSLRIAEAAEIRKPVQNLNKQEIFAIDLGADAIAEKVQVLKTLKDFTVLDPNIGQLLTKLAVLDRPLPAITTSEAFSYLEQPELPLSRDKPKRMKIVVLGTILGFMFGMFIVLVRFAFSRKD